MKGQIAKDFHKTNHIQEDENPEAEVHHGEKGE